MSRAITVSAIAAMLMASAPASAQQSSRNSDARAPDIAVGFDWSRVVEQKATDYQQQLALADAMSDRAGDAYLARDFRAARDAVRRAVKAYAEAAKLDPKNPTPHWRAGELLESYELVRNDADMARAAIKHWTAFEKLAPLDPRLSSVYFSRAFSYTYVFLLDRCCEDQLRRAVADYERRIQLYHHASPADFNRINLATTITNTAELVMTLGDLNRAISLYRQSLDVNDTSLTAYGLAVALDRDGQRAKALELMARYASSDPNFRTLQRQGVFFIPHGDIYYYRGLGKEALGKYQEAVIAYRTYLRYQGKSRFAQRARENLERVEKLAKRGRKSPSKAGPGY